jgi:hypothetical protein
MHCVTCRSTWSFPRDVSHTVNSTGLPLSTYFSAIKLRWMIDHYPEVAAAHEADDLLFGTVESWVAYVSQSFFVPCPCNTLMPVNFSFPLSLMLCAASL